MGNFWLPDLADWHRDAGIPTSEWPNWRTRSRSSGGYDDILGLGAHHDASSPATSLTGASIYGWDVAEFRPVGAIRVNRGTDKRVMIGAAGATNTQGKGGPLKCSRGTIPLDQGNRYVIAWEPLNNGVGETWTPEMIWAYTRSMAAVIVGLRDQGAYDAAARAYRRIALQIEDVLDIHAHFEWAPTRKIDPATGPDKLYPPNQRDRYGKFLMDWFREQVALQVEDIDGHVTPPPPTPEDDDDMKYLDEPQRIYDSRVHKAPQKNYTGSGASPLEPGQTRAIEVPFGKRASDGTGGMDAAKLNVTVVVVGDKGGHITVTAGNVVAGETSDLNWNPGEPVRNMQMDVKVDPATGLVKVTNGPTKVLHLIVDWKAYKPL